MVTETLEIIEALEKVIIDSLDEKNKIKNIDQYDIYIQLKGINELFQERFLLDWINYVKFKKPGYVIEDLKIILQLGIAGAFGETVHYDSDVFNDWTYKYGIKYTSKEILSSKRNYYLGEAYKKMSRQPEYDFRNKKYTSLSKLKQKYGTEYMKKYFPNIIKWMKGKIKIGREIDAPVTYKNDPLNE